MAIAAPPALGKSGMDDPGPGRRLDIAVAVKAERPHICFEQSGVISAVRLMAGDTGLGFDRGMREFRFLGAFEIIGVATEAEAFHGGAQEFLLAACMRVMAIGAGAKTDWPMHMRFAGD